MVTWPVRGGNFRFPKLSHEGKLVSWAGRKRKEDAVFEREVEKRDAVMEEVVKGRII